MLFYWIIATSAKREALIPIGAVLRKYKIKPMYDYEPELRKYRLMIAEARTYSKSLAIDSAGDEIRKRYGHLLTKSFKSGQPPPLW